MTPSAKTALIVLFPGVEEVEAVTPIDLLRRAGIEVTIAGIGPDGQITGRSGIVLGVETSLEAVAARAFDAVILPGGPGVKHLRASRAVVVLARAQATSGRLLAAICAAPTVLKDAGLLSGKRHTAHFSVEGELPEIEKSQAVVRDGNIITSRGAGTALEFAFEIIRALHESASDAAAADQSAQKLASAICYLR